MAPLMVSLVTRVAASTCRRMTQSVSTKKQIQHSTTTTIKTALWWNSSTSHRPASVGTARMQAMVNSERRGKTYSTDIISSDRKALASTPVDSWLIKKGGTSRKTSSAMSRIVNWPGRRSVFSARSRPSRALRSSAPARHLLARAVVAVSAKGRARYARHRGAAWTASMLQKAAQRRCHPGNPLNLRCAEPATRYAGRR